MEIPRWQVGGLTLGSFCLCLSFSATAMAGDTLSDVLKEKGVLSKEDWIRIQADQEKKEAEQKNVLGKDSPVKAGWSKKGFTLETLDGKWKTALQWRFQGRYSYPSNVDGDSASKFSDNNKSTFELRRVRMKIGGYGYEPWIKYYFEVDLQSTTSSGTTAGSTRLIDWRIDLAKYKWATLRVGQWKVNYNRERVDSSGKQTFVERSIVTNPFTIDRQVGALLMGRVFPGKAYDFNYYAGVFTGSGRGEANDDDNMMWMGRLQWNIFGRELAFSQSDVEYHEQPTGNLAFGGYTNIGKCTSWSSSGCGTLITKTSLRNSFTSDSSAADGEFRTDGMVEEFAMKWRGLAIQHEYHWKQIKDTGKGGAGTVGPSQTNLMGSYAQVSYFPHYLVPAIPKPIEVAFRYGFVDPNVSAGNDTLREYTAALNWFFAGHRNKITVDTTYFTLEQTPPLGQAHEQRVRLQWDVSF